MSRNERTERDFRLPLHSHVGNGEGLHEGRYCSKIFNDAESRHLKIEVKDASEFTKWLRKLNSKYSISHSQTVNTRFMRTCKFADDSFSFWNDEHEHHSLATKTMCSRIISESKVTDQQCSRVFQRQCFCSSLIALPLFLKRLI